MNHVALETQLHSSFETATLVSDPWTLRILRECFLNVRRIESLQSNLRIRRAQLTERLDRLISQGWLRRVCYQDIPRRYEYVLTEKGFEQHRIVVSLLPLKGRRWRSAGRQDRGSGRAQGEFATIFDGITVCPDCGEVLAKERTMTSVVSSGFERIRRDDKAIH